MSEARGGGELRPMKPFRGALGVLALGAIASVVFVVASLVAFQPVSAAHRHAEQIVRKDLPLQHTSAQLRDALVAWHLFLEPKLDQSEVGEPFTPEDISKGGELSKAQSDDGNALSAALRSRGLEGDARRLDAVMKTLSTAISNLAPAVTGADLTPTDRATIVAAERTAFTTVWAVTSSLSDVIRERTASDAQLAEDKSGLALWVAVVAGVSLVLLTLGATLAFALRVLRRQRRERLDAAPPRIRNRTPRSVGVHRHRGRRLQHRGARVGRRRARPRGRVADRRLQPRALQPRAHQPR